MNESRVTFRPLVDSDLRRLHRWLNDAEVVRWWEGDDVSWEAVQADYGSGSEESTEHWIAEVDGRPFGWAQCAPADTWHDQLAQWMTVGVEPTAAGIDYLVGAPEDRGRGLGTRMLAAFTDKVVFGQHPTWTQACADPLEDNVASWRALEKAGFTLLGIIEDEDAPSRLMGRNRPARS